MTVNNINSHHFIRNFKTGSLIYRWKKTIRAILKFKIYIEWKDTRIIIFGMRSVSKVFTNLYQFFKISENTSFESRNLKTVAPAQNDEIDFLEIIFFLDDKK